MTDKILIVVGTDNEPAPAPVLDPIIIELTESQRSLLVTAIRAGVERFIQCAKACRDAGHRAGSPLDRLADQFKAQAVEGTALADRIDNSEYVRIGPEVV